MTAIEECKGMLEQWDGKEPVRTVEMGGIGPGYEQCIQIVVMELVRAFNGKTLPTDEKELNEAFNVETHRLDRELELGMSGAQAGAAKQLAYRFLTDGPTVVLDKVEADRKILVSKHWPKTA